MDSDILCLGDVAELAHYTTLMDKYNTAVRVVKHDYVPSSEKKFLGQVQTKYGKKNWSSVMIFNNTLCRALTPKYVEEAPGLALHQFTWCDERQVGEMPRRWNYLVGEYPKSDDVRLLHYTKGTPCFPEYKDCEYADLWHKELEDMTSHG